MEIRLLGTGGWLPTDRRETACVYIRQDADVLLLDAGTGLRRLATEPALLEGVERVRVVLTHFHLDHTYGLMALPALKRIREREVWAPGWLVAGTTAVDLIHRLLAPPFLAAQVDDVTGELLTAIHELDRDVTLGPFHVAIRVQPQHAGPTVALRVGDELAYCTDTAYDEGNIDFARGVRVLLHEAFHAADDSEDTMHSAAGEAARIAEQAGVERLILIHVSPLLPDEDALVAFARRRFAATELGRDGLVV